MSDNKYSNSETYKLLADLQWRTDLTEFEKKRFTHVLETMDKMPGGKIRSQIQYLEKNILPTVSAKRGGEKAPDYIFFQGLINSLKWAVILYDRLERQLKEDALLRLERTLLLDRLQLCEKELAKYMLLEDLYLSEMLDNIDRGVRERLMREFEGKKK
jgi:hypothetical protein